MFVCIINTCYNKMIRASDILRRRDGEVGPDESFVLLVVHEGAPREGYDTSYAPEHQENARVGCPQLSEPFPDLIIRHNRGVFK
jgi:hypothetical protein